MRTTAAAAVVLTGALLLTGCHSQDPTTSTPTPTATTPSATPTPTPTPTPTDPEDANIAAAKAAYEAYNTASNTVRMTAGMPGFETQILPLLGNETIIAAQQNFYTQASAQGLRQTSETRLASMTVTKYVEDPTGSGNEQVDMEVCLDNTGVDVIDPSGKSVVLAGTPKREISVVLMQRQTDGRWTVNQDDADSSRPC